MLFYVIAADIWAQALNILILTEVVRVTAGMRPSYQ